MNPIPIISPLLSAIAVLLMTLPQGIKNGLYYNHHAILSGDWWQLITGHLLHSDTSHLVWNVVALLVLGSIIERRSRGLLLCSLFAGVVAVNLLLLSPFSHILMYCGLSGVLNTLLGVALYCYWRETRSPAIPAVAVLCLGKMVIETYTGQALITDTAWPAYPAAHWAGLVSAPVVIGLYFHSQARALFPGHMEGTYGR